MSVTIRTMGFCEYETTLKAMQSFTLQRDPATEDEIWIVEHPAVYTLGLNGKRKHLTEKNTIPVIDADRGGQVTYHGPGQLVAYVLCDLQRKNLGVQEFVNKLEQSIIDLLNTFSIKSERIQKAPGVYVNGEKIAALGLRIKHGRSYHGLSLNIDMDLQPFKDINPCGYPDLKVTQLKNLGITKDMSEIYPLLIKHLARNLGYNNVLFPVPESQIGS